MTKEEAIQILEDLDGYFSDNQGRDYDEAFRMAIEALQNEETFKTQLENCHREILRLLDFSDMTESPNDDIEPQNDVIEVVHCKDCRHADECQKSVQYTRSEPNTVTIGYTKIDFCSHGERKEE